MDIIIKKFKAIKPKTIAILAIAALCCAVLSSTEAFLMYDYWSNDSHLVFYLPDIIQILATLFSLSPYVLLALYVLKFHERGKATVIVPIIFALIALESLVLVVLGYTTVIGAVLNLLIAIAFGFATYGAFKGLSNKIFVLVATGVGLLLTLTGLVSSLGGIAFYFEYGYGFYVFLILVDNAASTLLYIALLFFGMKYEIPTLVGSAPKKQDPVLLYAEKELTILNEKLSLGLITPEEYQERKKDILSKL